MRLCILTLSIIPLFIQKTRAAQGWSPDANEDSITFPVKFFTSGDCSDSTSALGLDVRRLKAQIMYNTRLEIRPVRDQTDNTPSSTQPWQIPGIPTGPGGSLLGWNSVMINEGFYCEFKNGSAWNTYHRFGHDWFDDRMSTDMGKRCLLKSRYVAERNATVDVYDFSSTSGYYVCHNGTGIRQGPPLGP